MTTDENEIQKMVRAARELDAGQKSDNREALERLADLEFTSVELALFEDADQFKPSQIAADVDAGGTHPAVVGHQHVLPVANAERVHRLDPHLFDAGVDVEENRRIEESDCTCGFRGEFG